MSKTTLKKTKKPTKQEIIDRAPEMYKCLKLILDTTLVMKDRGTSLTPMALIHMCANAIGEKVDDGEI